MLWAVLTHLVGFVVDLVINARRTEDAKDLEIALLRHQLRLLLRRSSHPPRLSRWEKLTLAVLAAKLGRVVAGSRGRLSRAVLLVRPETVLKWHRELVRRKWTFRRRHAVGDRRSPPRSRPYCCGWLRRTRAGATADSRASWPSAATHSVARRCAIC